MGCGKLPKNNLRWLVLLIFVSLSCNLATEFDDELSFEGSEEDDQTDGSTNRSSGPNPDDGDELQPQITSDQTGPLSAIETKWDLWSSGETLLRGANIWQAVVIPELDGLEFKGDGHVGPPYTQHDFDRLAEFGANYVTVSGPGLFTEDPPFTPDQEVIDYMDHLLNMIAEADLFAIIAFRTGPGRSEYTLCCGGESYFDGYFNDTVWEDESAQEAWVEMWRFTAERYHYNPIVIGYKLMVEPNSEAVFFDVYEPEEFYPEHRGSSYDWNEFFPRIVEGIRSVDPDTPILVNGMGFSAIHWLPYLEPTDSKNIVYVAHQYAPFEQYTHQLPGGQNTYPGNFDLDWDESEDDFNRQWLEELLSSVDDFVDKFQVPVTIDEFGVNRWVPGAAVYMNDLMDLLENRGINYSLWEWQTSWSDFRLDVNDMDFRLGPDPENLSEVENDLYRTITNYWSRNAVRPSNVPWTQ